MSLAALISIGKDVALAVAAIVTATVAILGLRKWRKELRGKVDFEVARGLARATYRLRDEIQSARSPLIRGAEFPDGYSGKGQGSADEDARAWAHIYRRRWDPIAKALQEFDGQALEAESIWGPEIRERTEALRKCAHSLFIAFEAIVEDTSLGGENFKSDREFGRQVQADAHASITATDNPMSQKIADAVNNLEPILRAHLTRG